MTENRRKCVLGLFSSEAELMSVTEAYKITAPYIGTRFEYPEIEEEVSNELLFNPNSLTTKVEIEEFLRKRKRNKKIQMEKFISLDNTVGDDLNRHSTLRCARSKASLEEVEAIDEFVTTYKELDAFERGIIQEFIEDVSLTEYVAGWARANNYLLAVMEALANVVDCVPSVTLRELVALAQV